MCKIIISNQKSSFDLHFKLSYKLQRYFDREKLHFFPQIIYNLQILTVGLGADVKNGFTWKIIIVLKVRGGHGE